MKEERGEEYSDGRKNRPGKLNYIGRNKYKILTFVLAAVIIANISGITGWTVNTTTSLELNVPGLAGAEEEECEEDSDCAGSASKCVDNECVECASDADCEGEERPFCDNNKCVECLTNDDCWECEKCTSGGGGKGGAGKMKCMADCPADKFCVEDAPCKECRNSDDCEDPTPVCGGNHKCREADCGNIRKVEGPVVLPVGESAEYDYQIEKEDGSILKGSFSYTPTIAGADKKVPESPATEQISCNGSQQTIEIQSVVDVVGMKLEGPKGVFPDEEAKVVSKITPGSYGPGSSESEIKWKVMGTKKSAAGWTKIAQGSGGTASAQFDSKFDSPSGSMRFKFNLKLEDYTIKKKLKVAVGEEFVENAVGPEVVVKSPDTVPEYRCILERKNPAGVIQTEIDERVEYEADEAMEDEGVVLSSWPAYDDFSCTKELTVVGLEGIEMPEYVSTGEEVELNATTNPAGYGSMVQWYEENEEGLNKLNGPLSRNNPDTPTVVARVEQEYTNLEHEEVEMVGESAQQGVTVFEVADITLQEAEEDPLVIDADNRDMPSATFEVTTEPEIDLDSVESVAEWYSRLRYDEGNYPDIDDEISDDDPWWRHPDADGGDGTGWNESADATWNPEWDRLMGAEEIEANVRVSIEGSAFTPDHYEESTTNDGDGGNNENWVIKGENPENEQIVEETPEADDDSEQRRRGRLALIWQESSGRKFSPSPGFPLIGDDNPDDPNSTYGWGLMQLTLPHPTREQVWNWAENLSVGVDHFDGNYENTLNNVEDWHDWWTNDNPDPDARELGAWEWDPGAPTSDYNMRSEEDLEEILDAMEEGSIDWYDPENLSFDATAPEDEWPEWAQEDGEENVPPLRQDDDYNREDDDLDGESVHKVLNAQAYLQFNAGANEFPAMFGEFGVLRRYILDWDHITNYMDHYDEQPWND